jgi:hypothetical protein
MDLAHAEQRGRARLSPCRARAQAMSTLLGAGRPSTQDQLCPMSPETYR